MRWCWDGVSRLIKIDPTLTRKDRNLQFFQHNQSVKYLLIHTMDELISSSIVKEKVNSSSISEFASFKLNSKFQIKQSLTRCHWLRARWARPPLKGNYVAKELLQLKIGPGVNCQLVGSAWCLFKRLHSVLWIGITQLERIVFTRYEPCSVCCEFWTLSCSQSVV